MSSPYEKIKSTTIIFRGDQLFDHEKDKWVSKEEWVSELSREAYCNIVECPIPPEKGSELEAFGKDIIKYMLEWLEGPKA